uniref:Uncharacterized protein n=1 Tax=Amphimedon queenslandica TaxID=400682 RepID=A0A1X7SF75_AMPQE
TTRKIAQLLIDNINKEIKYLMELLITSYNEHTVLYRRERRRV